MHGYFVRSWYINYDEVTTLFWITKGDLPMETEGLLFAAQDQTLCTRALQRVFSNSSTAQCQLCNSQAEIV